MAIAYIDGNPYDSSPEKDPRHMHRSPDTQPQRIFKPERVHDQLGLARPGLLDVRDVPHLLGFNPTDKVTPETLTALTVLATGLHPVDVEIVHPDTGIYGSDEALERVMLAVTDLESRFAVDGLKAHLFREEVHPVGHAWQLLSKRAIALGILNDPSQETLGGLVTPDAYDRPLFDGKSAKQILEAEKPKKAGKIIGNYEAFVSTRLDDPSDQEDEYGLPSREYLAHVPDSIAVRLRSAAAADVITYYAQHNAQRINRAGGLKITSLACGAAAPTFKLLRQLEQSDVKVRQAQLVDWDVMALASAFSQAEKEDALGIIDIQRADLVKGDMREYLHDADAVDMLGLFEYFPALLTNMGMNYPMASLFLREVGKAMKPGSMIVLGNMLDSRHHQTMFNQVWPKLEQRSPSEVIDIIMQAGFPRESISVRVPEDGVYAIYSIIIPETGISFPKTTMRDRISKYAIQHFVKEY